VLGGGVLEGWKVKGTSVVSEAVDGLIPCEMKGDAISGFEVFELILLLTSR
jgi:hypothetical protein